MAISIDTNVIAALWNNDHPSKPAAAGMLDSLLVSDKLVVSGVVYSELMAGPLRDEGSLDLFFGDTGIEIDWVLDEEIWREAGRAYRGYVRRRKLSKGGPPKRILADFIIGAHAVIRGHSVLTLNKADYVAAFPTLKTLSE